MKHLTLCLCFLAAVPLFAGKRIQMESTNLTSKATEQQEILLDSTRMRMNAANTSVMFLTDGGRNRMVTIDKGRNEYMEIDQQTMDQMGQAMQGVAAQMEAAMKGMPPEQRAQMQAMMEQMMKGRGAPVASAAPAVTTYTSKGRGTANGFACTNYDGTRAGQKVSEVCAAQPADLKLGASDFQVLQKMREFSRGLQQAMQNSPFGAATTASIAESGIDGFPVQTTTFQNGQATRQEVIKAVTDASFTDADFSVGNAKKTELPDMSGLTGAPGRANKGKNK